MGFCVDAWWQSVSFHRYFWRSQFRRFLCMWMQQTQLHYLHNSLHGDGSWTEGPQTDIGFFRLITQFMHEWRTHAALHLSDKGQSNLWWPNFRFSHTVSISHPDKHSRIARRISVESNPTRWSCSFIKYDFHFHYKKWSKRENIVANKRIFWQLSNYSFSCTNKFSFGPFLMVTIKVILNKGYRVGNESIYTCGADAHVLELSHQKTLMAYLSCTVLC